MQRYRDDEDLDEYEDDLEDQYGDADEDQYEDEEEEEEVKEKPKSADEIKYLNFREKLKAKHRSMLRRENGKNGANIHYSQLGNYGNFFGPSTPSIAERVIQESKSLLETRHLGPKVSIPQNDVKKVSMSSTTTSKNGTSDKPLPRQVQSKAQIIKQTRDYSWLLSDEAEIPKPAKDPGPRNSAPKPGLEDARSAQLQAKRNETSSHLVKKVYDGSEPRKKSSGIPQARDSRSAPSEKSTSSNRASYTSSDSRRLLDLRKPPQPNKQTGSSSVIRSTVQKSLPPKKPLSSGDRKMPVGSMERKSFGTPVGNKASSAVARTSTLDRQRPPVVKPQASGVNSGLVHKRDVHRIVENKMLKKENVAASKSQIMKPPKPSSLQSNLEKRHQIKQQKPAGQLQKSFGALDINHKIKKRRSPEPEPDFDYRAAIRSLFRYNPSQYGDDEDDDNMEADFETITKEERRSARIAKREDDEEWIKIQEDDRRERLAKKPKIRR